MHRPSESVSPVAIACQSPEGDCRSKCSGIPEAGRPSDVSNTCVEISIRNTIGSAQGLLFTDFYVPPCSNCDRQAKVAHQTSRSAAFETFQGKKSNLKVCATRSLISRGHRPPPQLGGEYFAQPKSCNFTLLCRRGPDLRRGVVPKPLFQDRQHLLAALARCADDIDVSELF